ncbi:interleukin-7 receptor subunit alpha isoform X2 [Oryzias melastigma]|uniref:Interleukin 7 receptor n=1 Tax=Oryzias melastigma TaxID=30732 RepID=A0A3B3BFE2_ORYME|nr:interleukin-7 receptor subunit alpha isoform X2 [Oryzias melastigma]
MAFGRKMGALLLLMMMWSGCRAQSGDGDSELRMSCSSHISTRGCNVTCQLQTDASSSEDEEDEEGNSVVKTSMCYSEWTRSGKKTKCVEAAGDSVHSGDLSPVVPVKVTVLLQRGGRLSSVLNLTKIVKPQSPQVWNVSFDLETNQTVIFIKTPYQNDFLRVENQLFQLHIWTAGQNLIQNISSQDCLKFDMNHLQRRSQYHVKVRSIPCGALKGSWSDWSETVSFSGPADPPAGPVEQRYQLVVCSVLVVVMICSAFIFWRKQILTFIWPIIPHPKQTLVQICRPHKGLLLSLNPEEFSSLNVSPVDPVGPVDPAGPVDPMDPVDPVDPVDPMDPVDPVDPVDQAAPEDQLLASSPQPSSTQSSDCRSTTSVSTEELEISALPSRTSSDSEDSWQNAGSASIHQAAQQNQQDTTPPEGGSAASSLEFRVTQPEEAYVTMSSFYRTK